jgi:hypothetical protein
MRPQTNGMVERFNGRIEGVLQSHRFRSAEDLEQTILRCVQLYNGQLPQTVLKGRTPIGALKDWHRQKPEQLGNGRGGIRRDAKALSSYSFADRRRPSCGNAHGGMAWSGTSSVLSSHAQLPAPIYALEQFIKRLIPRT